jgi:excisionase family DNA binding protein
VSDSLSAWPAFSWDEPVLIIDGIECTADASYLEANCGPPPPDPSLVAAMRAAVAAELDAREGSTRVWLTREQAAQYLGVSLRTFDGTVRRSLAGYRVGRCVRFRVSDLDAWLDTRKVGGSENRRVKRPTASGSASTAGASNPPLVNEIRSRLRKPLRESMPTRSNGQADSKG